LTWENARYDLDRGSFQPFDKLAFIAVINTSATLSAYRLRLSLFPNSFLMICSGV
jgi:hypothetical protein